jgi:hypothetical protein
LDGILGEGELRHLARWQAVKTILRVEEEDENGVTTILEKEQFSHCLNLLYADGRTAVLTNDPPPEQTGEQTAATDTSGKAVPPELRLEEVRDEERA